MKDNNRNEIDSKVEIILDEVIQRRNQNKQNDLAQTEGEELVDINSLQFTSQFQPKHNDINTGTPITKTANKLAKKTNNKKNNLIVAGVIVSALLLTCSFFAIIALNPKTIPTAAPVPAINSIPYKNSDGFVFAKGIYIAGIDIGGKTERGAKALIKIKEPDIKSDFSLNVHYGDKDKLTFTQDNLWCSFNTDEVIEQAAQYSNDLSNAIKQGTVDNLVPPSNSNVKISNDNNIIDFNISLIIDDDSVEKIVNECSEKIDKKAIEPHAEKYDPNAKSFDKMFKWVEGSNGTIIDKEALESDIKNLFKNGAKSGDVTVKTVVSKPKHTMDQVKNSVQLIGTFSTVSTNGYNASKNMAVSLAAMDGAIIDPGKVYSFNELTGNSNLTEKGYLPAGVIQNGGFALGVGGGICQSSTTIYNAMIRAGMGVVEREYHLYASTYVYGGLDATIDYGNIDLKMKNTTDYQIFIHSWMDGATLHCEIYGWQPYDWDEIRTESKCSYIEGGYFGFKTQRVYYKNGKEVKRENLPDSKYRLDGRGVVAGDNGKQLTKIKDPKKNLKM